MHTTSYLMHIVIFIFTSCEADTSTSKRTFHTENITSMNCECVMMKTIGSIAQVNCDDKQFKNSALIKSTDEYLNYTSTVLGFKLDSCLSSRQHINKLFSIEYPTMDLPSSIINSNELINSLKPVIRKAILASNIRVPNMDWVAKPNEFAKTSIVRTTLEGEKITHNILILNHDRNDIIKIIRIIEELFFLHKALPNQDRFSIQFPIRFYRKDQLETWADFERRTKQK